MCYKAEHTAAGTNLRFVITNCPGRASEVFAFYNDRGECENCIEEFKNGFRADRLSCHRFLANAFRLLLHGFAYNLVILFRLQLPEAWRSAQIETLRARLFKFGARVRQTARCIRSCPLPAGWTGSPATDSPRSDRWGGCNLQGEQRMGVRAAVTNQPRLDFAWPRKPL
ncbi:MAG TPA: transposase [Terriglobales bacterium]|nr:transposase [Terriglobales bacterium]